MPPQVAQTVGPQNHQQRPTKKCGSLNVEMVVVWTVVDAFCGPTVCATTGGADTCSTKTSTTAHKNCGSLNVDMVVVWAVVDVFVGHKDINNGPRKHQRPTQLLLRRLLRLLESDCCGSLNVDMVVVWTVVDAFCEPTVCATTGGADSWSTKTSTTAHKNCGSLNVDMVVVWAVVDVFVGQLSVPPQVAQTAAPQRH